MILGQVTRSLVGHVKGFGLYSVDSQMPLKSFEQRVMGTNYPFFFLS